MFFTKRQVIEAFNRYNPEDAGCMDDIHEKVFTHMEGAYVIKPSLGGYYLLMACTNGYVFRPESHYTKGIRSLATVQREAFDLAVFRNRCYRESLEQMHLSLENSLLPLEVENTEQFDEVSEEVTCVSF